MLLFEVCAFAIVALAVSRSKYIKTGNELFEQAQSYMLERFDKCLGEYSFFAFFAIFAVVSLSLPLIFFRTDYVESVLMFESYLPIAVGIVLILVLIYLKGKAPYCKWILRDQSEVADKDAEILPKSEMDVQVARDLQQLKKRRRVLNYIQILATIFAGIFFFVVPYFEVPYEISPISMGLAIAALLLFVVNILCFVIFEIIYKENRKQLLLPGIRNMLLLPSAYLMARVHNVYWTGDYDFSTPVRGEYWTIEYLYYAIGWALFVVVVCEVLVKLAKKYD